MDKDITMVFPKPYNGIQVNYCVSTGCENFGLSDPVLYQAVYNTKSLNIYHCPKCGAYPQIINNRSIYQTIEHQKKYHALSLISCPKGECSSHTLAVHAYPQHYRAFGKTNSLKQRYQCRSCKTVFTDQLTCLNPQSEAQNAIFYGMMYSFGVRNICQKLNITAKAFYKLQRGMVDRLKYIAHVKEEAFYQKIEACNLSTSYQFLGDQQGAMLVATAHTASGYILGFDTNITSDMASECLLNVDAKTSTKRPIDDIEQGDLMMDITAQYEVIMARKNYLDPTSNGRSVSHSYKGVLSQPYLASFAHALVLRNKLQHKSHRYYFVEQDTMLRNAFMNASLQDLIRSEDHLFYFRESAQKMEWFNEQRLNIRHVGWWKDKWGFLSEENKTKAACHIKGQDLSVEQWQTLLQDASLDGVQHYLTAATEFFQGLGTTLNEQSFNDWLHVFTGYYNFCWPHRNGKTPAQLLGFFDRPITLGELLNGYELT